jgi:hypothetical protein
VTLHFTLLAPTYGDTIASECGTFVWYEHNCATTGDYVHTFVGGNVAGCDSIVTLHYTAKEAKSFEDSTSVCSNELPYTWYGVVFTEAKDSTFTIPSWEGCDSIVTLHLTVKTSYNIVLADVEEACQTIVWKSAEGDTTINNSGTYTRHFTTVEGCDSLVTRTFVIHAPKYDTLPALAKYGNRLLVIDRIKIMTMPGWETVLPDSIYNEEKLKGRITWYKMKGATPDISIDQRLDTGYYYHNAELTALVGCYYAYFQLRPATEAMCEYEGYSEVLCLTAPASAPAPALMPSLARPGEDIKVVNLDPESETAIRIFSADGLLQRVYSTSGEETFTIKAADNNGIYMVELVSDNLRTTLRYIVK